MSAGRDFGGGAFMGGIRCGLALLVLIMAAGCVGPAKQIVDRPSQIGRGETVVVGRVELVPPLSESERDFGTWSMKPYSNKIFLLADDHWRLIDGEPGLGDLSGRVEATWGETFFVKNDAAPLYILEGMSWTTMNSADEVLPVYFPDGFKIDIRSADRAVYIGTIRYHRDEFFRITKVEVVDDYRRVSREFKSKFGARLKLRRSLARRVKRG